MAGWREWKTLGLWIALFLLVAGGLGGVAVERLRLESRRAAMLEHLHAVIRTYEQP